uniref:Secreted protein n=1 Tax=Ascaris lumbricoides TaxID=6252 RepID=A0A0M3I8D5_ASCLU
MCATFLGTPLTTLGSCAVTHATAVLPPGESTYTMNHVLIISGAHKIDVGYVRVIRCRDGPCAGYVIITFIDCEHGGGESLD